MAAFLITLTALVALIAVGIACNLYLYSRGALGMRRLRPASRLTTGPLAPSNMVGDQFYMGLGASNKTMGTALRRLVLVAMFVLIAFSALLALALSGAH